MFTLFECQPKTKANYPGDYTIYPADFLLDFKMELAPGMREGYAAIFPPFALGKNQTHHRVCWFARNTSPTFKKAEATRKLSDPNPAKQGNF